MTEAMPFLRKLILLSYDPRPSGAGSLLFPAFMVQFLSKSPRALRTRGGEKL